MATAQHKIELGAQKREVFGRKVNGLRDSGYIPAVLYGRDQENISLQVPAKDFYKALKEAGESTLVYLNIDKQTYPTIIHDVSRDPVKDDVIHADFYKVRLDEKIKAHVPIIFDGKSPAVEDLGGIFVANTHELEVEALPQDLPHEIKIDISSLVKFNDQLSIKDVKTPKGVELMGEENTTLALIQEPKSQEELDEELAAPTEGVEAVEIGKEKKEGEEGEEGEGEAKEDKPAEEKPKEETKEKA